MVHVLAHLLLLFIRESVKLKRRVIFCLPCTPKHLMRQGRFDLDHLTIERGLECVLIAALHGKVVWVLGRVLVIILIPCRDLNIEQFSNVRATYLVLASSIERMVIYSVDFININ